MTVVQRVTVARALLSGARYLVADEISALLDPITRAQIWQVLCGGAHAGHLGILAITHDDALLDRIATRRADMAAGEERAPSQPPGRSASVD